MNTARKLYLTESVEGNMYLAALIGLLVSWYRYPKHDVFPIQLPGKVKKAFAKKAFALQTKHHEPTKDGAVFFFGVVVYREPVFFIHYATRKICQYTN